MRLLIVEDDPRVARTWTRVLEAEGHEVLVAASCAEGRAVIREAASLSQSLDVVLLDEGLPDGSGSSLLEPLALHLPGAAVAVVSGVLDADRALELIHHAVPAVPKPLSVDGLLRLVELLRPSPDGLVGRSRAFAEAHRLSRREAEVLRSGVLGLSAAQAAEAIGCAEPTVYTYWCRIFHKTGLASQREVLAAVLGIGGRHSGPRA